MALRIIFVLILVLSALSHVRSAEVSKAKKALKEDDSHTKMLEHMLSVYDTTRNLQPDVAAREDAQRIACDSEACGTDDKCELRAVQCKMRAAQVAFDSANEESKMMARLSGLEKEDMAKDGRGHVGPFGERCACGLYFMQNLDD